MDEKGIPARNRVSRELTLEKAFGMKRKVPTQRERRGGIPAMGNPGDKHFRKVDHFPGFQQAGEFTVGSSFYRTSHRRGREQTPHGAPVLDAVVPEGIGYAIGHRKPKINFQEMRKAWQYLDDLRGVLELTQAARPSPNASSAQDAHHSGESWEEKTGMRTWPKKMKASATTVGTE